MNQFVKHSANLSQGFFGKMLTSKESHIEEKLEFLSATEMYKMRKNQAIARET